eukprot:COSAG02_NODE_27535_length_607_cov_1.143701_2_plen_88_part_01
MTSRGEALNVYVDREEHTEYVLGLTIEEWHSSCEAATAAVRKAAGSSKELDVSEISSGDPAVVSMPSEARERPETRDFTNDKRIVVAR